MKFLFSLLLEFFKGSVIMRSTHVLQGMLGNNIRNLETTNPYIFGPRFECQYPENLANYVIDLSEMTNETVGLHSFVMMTIPQKYGLYVMEWSKYTDH